MKINMRSKGGSDVSRVECAADAAIYGFVSQVLKPEKPGDYEIEVEDGDGGWHLYVAHVKTVYDGGGYMMTVTRPEGVDR